MSVPEERKEVLVVEAKARVGESLMFSNERFGVRSDGAQTEEVRQNPKSSSPGQKQGFSAIYALCLVASGSTFSMEVPGVTPSAVAVGETGAANVSVPI